MDDISRVEEIDAAEKVVKNNENVIVSESLRSLRCENLLQVQIHVVYHQEYLVERFQMSYAHSLFIWNNNIVKFCCK